MNILIAEVDNKTISDLKSILNSRGHEILCVVSTGAEAIEKTRKLKPDLIFINIKLKGPMSRVEAVKEILKFKKIPIIFISVFTKNCLIKSLQLPDDAIVISEPIKKEHLEYCISRAVS
jgi:two-component SAPR family response regulator